MTIQFYAASGQQLAYSIRRPADGFLLDPADLAFKAPAVGLAFPLAEEPTPNLGSYLADFAPYAAKVGLDAPVEVQLRRLDSPDTVRDGFPLFFKAGKGYSVAELFNQVGPAVVDEVRASLEGISLNIQVGGVRVGAQSR